MINRKEVIVDDLLDPQEREIVRVCMAMGRGAGLTEAIFTVLSARGIDVPPAAHMRILSEYDAPTQHAWLRNACIASSVEDVFGTLGHSEHQRST